MASNNTTAPLLDLSIIFAANITVFTIGSFSILTNGSLLVITFLDPLKKFKRSSIYFITSLSFSDFLTGIICCLYAFQDKISLDPIFQKAISASIWASVQNSFITILLMSVERLFVVKNPLGVRSFITKRRTMLVIAIGWIVSLLSGAATAIPKPYRYHVRFGLMIEFTAIVLVMLFIYLRILVLLRKSNNLFKGKKFSGNSRAQITANVSRNTQHTLNLLVFNLAVILILTVVPHLTLALTVYSYLLFCPTDCTITTAMDIALHFTLPIELLHFVLNPIVYAWRLSEYRKSLGYYLVRRNHAVYDPNTFSFTRRNSKPLTTTKVSSTEDDTIM